MYSNNCIIYCTCDFSINNFRLIIADFLGSGIVGVSFIQKDFYELSIYANDNFDINKQMIFPDGFLNFKFIIDVGFNEHSDQKKCIEEISKILEWLWRIGVPAVASCDYENLLPKKGGYNSTEIPWQFSSNIKT